MSIPSSSVAATIHTPQEILAHRRFPAARTAFVDAVLALHEGDAFHSRLLVEAMRQVTFNLLVSFTCAMTPPIRRHRRPCAGSRRN